MAISKSHPLRFTPRGTVDAFDSTDKFQGACQQLTNLVFDPANPELVVSRPGVVPLINLSAYGNVFGFISVQVSIGTRIYGMAASNLTANYDQPFCFDTATGLFIAITGITSGNVPLSPPSSGPWIPPMMASVGTMLLVTHQGFSGTGTNYFGMFDLTNPAAPAWSTKNTATNALPGVPTAVANFNNRAWFAYKNTVYYTDVLTNPPTRTNATQALVIGDSSPVTALAGLPLQTTSSGILGALTAFKQTSIWQITGDTVTTNLALNFLDLTTGTLAPRAIAQSNEGLYFIAPAGPYVILPIGIVRQLTNTLQQHDPDLQEAFVNVIEPSRMCAAYNSGIYRLCGEVVLRGVDQVVDYWFDEDRRRWSGPHTFQYDCVSALATTFVLSSVNHPGQLMESQSYQSDTSVYTDLGSLVSFVVQSSTFPKVGDMLMKQVAESQIELAASGGEVTYTITAQDESGNTLGQAIIVVNPAPPKWGTFIWGAFNWAAGNIWGGGNLWGAPPIGSGSIWSAPKRVPNTYPVPWAAPLVFEKMQLLITGTASSNVGIGTFYARYQKTGYMTLGPGD